MEETRRENSLLKLQEPGPWSQALAAARANLIPGLVLQSFALAIVFGYYFLPPFQAFLNQIADFKTAWGWWYSLVATALFGGLIPFLYLRLHPATRASTPPAYLLFYLVFWGYKGLEVDALYRLQALVFGSHPDISTIAAKVAVDQFIYNPFWTAPTALVVFLWKDEGFRLNRLQNRNWIAFFRRTLPAALLGTWAVWMPTVAIIYALPSALQVPLFNIVLCFWVLMFTTLTRPKV